MIFKRAPIRHHRLDKSIAAIEADLAEAKIPPFKVADDFIDTTDASNFEGRLAQLSPKMYELIERTAKNNILTFDSIIAELRERNGYVGGWIALRDWARRQPWVEEATRYALEVQARSRAIDEASEGSDLSFSEQGRMLGILRVELMRATSDSERDEIKRMIAELEDEFRQANRG